MSINLVDLLKNQVGSQIAGPASKLLGESESSTSKALGAIIPSVLGGLVDKGSDAKGAADVMSMLNKADSGILNNISGAFVNNGNNSQLGGLMNSGGGMLSSLLGNNKMGTLIDSVSGFAGIKKNSASSLLKLATPFLMGAISKKVSGMNLDASGLSSLLGSQKSNLSSAIPSGFGNPLGLSSISTEGMMDKITDKVESTVDKTVETTKDVAEDTARGAKKVGSAAVETGKDVAEAGAGGAKSLLKWVIPALIILGLLGFFGIKTCSPVDKAAKAVSDTTEKAVKGTAGAVGDAAGAVGDAAKAVVKVAGDALALTGDALKGVFSTVNETAKAALDKIEFAAGSAGDQIMNFIEGGFAGENRFTFNNLSFETGSAAINAETAEEVNNIAAILKAYPDVNIIIEGYTDNTGDAATNNELSLQRAEAVKKHLVEKQGIDASRIKAEGYGSTNPVASNATEEGKAKNRRIELRIIK